MSSMRNTKKRLRDSLESDPLCDDTNRSAKRKRSAQSELHIGHRPLGFWDSLSKAHLTRGALREFDRRSAQSGQRSLPVPAHSGTATELRIRQLKRFSRHGGPDLTDIRGFTLAHDQDGTMSQSSSSRKRSSASGRSNSTRSDTTRKSKSSYDPKFKQNLIDSGIYPHDRGSKPTNIHEIKDDLGEHRASLSPSRFGDAEFEEFADLNDRAASETRVMADVLTIIEGKGRHRYFSGGPDHPFNQLTPFTEFLPTAKPDTYDGAFPEQIDRRVRHDLGRHIVPCNDSSRPAGPNFFIEGKSASGRADVAKLQACHDGAIGARAMDSLQNYGASEPKYDSNMKSFSTTYHPRTGTLKLYGHHPTRPQAPGNRPEYHMTQIGGYDMTHKRETFQEGATAFRNLRELAQRRRDELINQANRIAQHASTKGLSITLTDSRTSLPALHENEPNTSADELAAEETTTKRTRHLPQAQSRNRPVIRRHPTSINNVSPHTVSDSVTPHHSTPRIGNATSHSNARSRHEIDDAMGEQRRQT